MLQCNLNSSVGSVPCFLISLTGGFLKQNQEMLTLVLTQGDTTITLAWRRTLKSIRHSQQGSHELTIDRQTRNSVPTNLKKSLISLHPDMGVIFFRRKQPPPPNQWCAILKSSLFKPLLRTFFPSQRKPLCKPAFTYSTLDRSAACLCCCDSLQKYLLALSTL